MKKFPVFLAAICLLLQPVLAEPAVLHAPQANARQYGAPLAESHPFEEAEDRLVIDFIDIGTGDAILVRSGGESMLVDGGVAFNADTLEQFFRAQMVGKIDYFFNTHPHGDHILAQRQLLIRDCLPGVFLSMVPMDYRFKEHQDTVAQIIKKGVPYHQVKNGDTLRMGQAVLTFFNDDRPVTNIPMNYRGMMLNITFGGRSVLLTADVTGESLALLGEKYPELMDVDILKSPHHGLNRLRAETYEHISPEAVVITSTKSKGENLAKQLIARKIPHYFISMGTVRLETDGSQWYLRQMPDTK
ncbi:MAG: MBL fold metallo-hydrolase [Eubacteriales bacterium]|nr:MBL fold metallo-hydrolase [Eubacteriales bacterium]